MPKKVTQKNTPRKAPGSAVSAPESRWSLKDLAILLGVQGKAALNVMLSLGPLALSLWPTASKNMLKHQLAEEGILGLKRGLELENENYAAVERTILDQIPKASPKELLEVEQKLEFLRSKRCQIDVVGKALVYLNENENKVETRPAIEIQAANPPSPPQEEPMGAEIISDHWVDHFNRLARQRNEPWRAELLARALAAESKKPGSVSPKALFEIGMLDEVSFHKFILWLNHSVFVEGGRHVVVWFDDYAKMDIAVPTTGGSTNLRYLRTDLEEAGLTGGHGNLVCPGITQVSYGKRHVSISSESHDLTIVGSISTDIGGTLAQFHHQEPTELGYEIFDGWLSSIDRDNFKVVE